MNFKDRIQTIKAAFTGTPNQSLLTMAQRFTPAYGEPPRRSTEDWIGLYNKSPRMNPIHQIASDVGTSSYGIYNNGDTKKIKLPNTPAEMLLKKPNPQPAITEYALFYVTQVYLLLPSGEAFWIKERNGIGKVTELWPIPPSWVLEIPSATKPYFTIYPQGNMYSTPIQVIPTDMVYFKKPDVNNPYLRGVGRAEGIGDEIETDEYMAKYQKRFFFNNAIPPMVGMMPGGDEPTVKRAEEQWNQKYGGYNNSHKVAWLNWDAKFQILKETAKDMDFIESRKYLRDVTNQHFSIPPELFGILENSNRSTIDAAYYLYTKNVLRKELKFIDDVLNIQLIPEFSKEIYLEHDNVVPEDDEFKLKKASEGLKNGGIIVDEWRMANGWEPLPNDKGKILYTPLNMIPTSLTESSIEEPTDMTITEGGEKVADTAMNGAQISSLLLIVTSVASGEIPRETGIQVMINAFQFDLATAERIMGEAGQGFESTALPAETPAQPTEPETESEPVKEVKKKALTPEMKDQMWQVMDKAAVKNERPFINALKKYFQAQQDRINSKLVKSIKSVDDVDWEEEDKLFYDALKPLWISSLTEGFETVNDTFKLGVSFDVMNPKFLKWVKDNGLDRVKDINNTTKDKLRTTLEAGIADGESIVKLRDRIASVYSDAKGYRSTMIARTETITTVNAGSLDTYKSAKVKQKEWLSQIDNRTRIAHVEINGEIVDIDKEFSNGYQYPQEPNCRCTILAVLPE